MLVFQTDPEKNIYIIGKCTSTTLGYTGLFQSDVLMIYLFNSLLLSSSKIFGGNYKRSE
jgi:hypothetical protein